MYQTIYHYTHTKKQVARIIWNIIIYNKRSIIVLSNGKRYYMLPRHVLLYSELLPSMTFFFDNTQIDNSNSPSYLSNRFSYKWKSTQRKKAYFNFRYNNIPATEVFWHLFITLNWKKENKRRDKNVINFWHLHSHW